MKLNFRKYGEGKPLIILHGVFGSSDNWQTVGKELANHFLVYLVDQRNHGLSPHSDDFNYELMVSDILELMQDENLSKATLIGHSMGGKTAMSFATKYPSKVENLVVVDISPRSYPPHHANIFEGFKSVKIESITSRKDADDQLAKTISNFGIRQFILKNLHRNGDGGFEWKLNLEAIEKHANEIGAALESDARFNGNALFISGEASNYIQKQDEDLILGHFPKAKITGIPQAGHWVHAEKPKETLQIIFNFLSK